MKHFFTIALLACGTLARTQSLSDNLIAHFPMDGNPDDVIGGLIPTVITGSPGFCDDRFGNANAAACFDGASFWSYGDVLDMDTCDFSISCWINVDTVPEPFQVAPTFWDYGGIPILKGNTIQGTPQRAGYSLVVRQLQPGDFRAYWSTGGSSNDVFSADHGISLDSWDHFVMARCGIHQLLYINGVLVADSIIPPGRDLDVNIVFTFGALNRDPSGVQDTEFFNGALDDVRIYKGRCLNQAEIDTLAQDISTAINGETAAPASVLIFPDPAAEHLTILPAASATGHYSLKILDASGRTVLSEDHHLGRAELDLDHVCQGAYFVKLQGEQWEAHGRFIKE